VNVTILILPLCVWLMAGLCTPACGQSVLCHSSSGQFTARRLKDPAVLTPIAKSSGQTGELALEPALLVSECEQVKRMLLAELGMQDDWRGRIDLIINPALAEDSEPQLTAISRPQGWTYELLLAQHVTHEILLRKLFQTLFLEMANRHSGVQSVDVPLWLVEGMSAHLEANSLPALLLQPGQAVSRNIVWNRNGQTMPLELRQHPGLSFQELSWPEAADVTPQGLPLYRSCAQLFLEGLLKFADGKACLRSMIERLSEHWNWQTTFLQAFHSHFDQLLDVEKWWSVNYIDCVRGYKAQAWSGDESRRSLQSSLDIPVQVHFDSKKMPAEAKVTLQEVIQKWTPWDARDAIERAVAGLKFLEPRAAEQWRPLTQLYLKTLLEYLKDCETAERNTMLGKNPPPLLKIAKDGAIKRLNALDQQREALWAGSVSTNTSQLGASEALPSKTVAVH
jgi:hypothetical protein